MLYTEVSEQHNSPTNICKNATDQSVIIVNENPDPVLLNDETQVASKSLQRKYKSKSKANKQELRNPQTRVAGPAVLTNNRFSHLRVEEANNVPAEILNGHRQKENQSENKPNIAIVGDSMIKNINPRKLSRKRVNKFMFPGKRAEEIASEVKNINVQLHPTHVIIHAGTNNLPTDTGDQLQCVRNIPKAKLGVSSIILRKDIEVSSKMYQVNEDLKRLCNESGFSFIDNSIVDESGLNNSKLHLSAKGSALLATRFIKFLNPDKQLNKQPVGNHVSSENFLRDLLNLAALTQNQCLKEDELVN